MNRKIAVLTTNRSDYGLLRNVIKKLQQKKIFTTDVLVSGSHFEPIWGNTYQEIEKDSIKNIKRINIFTKQNIENISFTMADTIRIFSSFFYENKYEMLLVLGDRYETFAVCVAALNQKIPIAHIHGGEITEGALDNYYRHCITKMSYLHFTSLPEYQQRVIQMGESPNRVFCVGALGVENALKMPLMEKKELEKSISFTLDRPYAMITYHPVSMEDTTVLMQLENLLQVIKTRDDLKYIITYANSDQGGKGINQFWQEHTKKMNHILLIESLGMIRYLSAIKYAHVVMGNSSSGIIEVPSFHVPTINIGERQKGRIHATTVIDCDMKEMEIEMALVKADNMIANKKFKSIKNPYEGNDTSTRITNLIMEKLEEHIELKKEFYDL